MKQCVAALPSYSAENSEHDLLATEKMRQGSTGGLQRHGSKQHWSDSGTGGIFFLIPLYEFGKPDSPLLEDACS